MPHVEGNPTPDCGLRGLALLDRVLDEIESNKEHWRQNSWASAKQENPIFLSSYNDIDDLPAPKSCGTAFCVAGWAAHLTGASIDWKPVRVLDYNVNQYKVVAWNAETVNGGDEYIEQFARKVLGLTVAQADALFAGPNSFEQILVYRDMLESGEEFVDNNF